MSDSAARQRDGAAMYASRAVGVTALLSVAGALMVVLINNEILSPALGNAAYCAVVLVGCFALVFLRQRFAAAAAAHKPPKWPNVLTACAVAMLVLAAALTLPTGSWIPMFVAAAVLAASAVVIRVRTA